MCVCKSRCRPERRLSVRAAVHRVRACVRVGAHARPCMRASLRVHKRMVVYGSKVPIIDGWMVDGINQ